jgi:uncharacterized protein YjiS (DUF1127 family)
MPSFVDTLLLRNRTRRYHRIGHLDDRLLADIGMPRDEMRRMQPFLLGSMVARSG